MVSVAIVKFGKQFITQTVGNKTLTKVFDKEGKFLFERLKTIEKSNVGSKNVITRTSVSVANSGKSLEGNKQIYDRVYDSSGKYLGFRNVEYRATSQHSENPISLIDLQNRFVTKGANDGGVAVTKKIMDGKATKGWIVYPEGAGQKVGYKNSQYYNETWKCTEMKPSDFGYDDKGLPIMQEWDSIYDNYSALQNSSLADRIKTMYDYKMQNYEQRAQFFENKLGKSYSQLKHLGNYNRNPRFKVDWFKSVEPKAQKVPEVKIEQSMFNLENYI